jgi:hypothetical protein
LALDFELLAESTSSLPPALRLYRRRTMRRMMMMKKTETRKRRKEPSHLHLIMMQHIMPVSYKILNLLPKRIYKSFVNFFQATIESGRTTSFNKMDWMHLLRY